MTTEHDNFSQERYELVKLLSNLLAQPTGEWQYTERDRGVTELGIQVRPNPDNLLGGVSVKITFKTERIADTLGVMIDGTGISMGRGDTKDLSEVVTSFCLRRKRDENAAVMAEESKAIQALALAMAATRISANCKVTVTPILPGK